MLFGLPHFISIPGAKANKPKGIKNRIWESVILENWIFKKFIMIRGKLNWIN